jgi:hypothetical protein
MAGSIFAKERAAVTLTSSGSSLTNGSAGSAGTDFDARTSGNAADDFQAQFELTCQWATVTGIVAGTTVADLYLVPKLDGTNLPDVDVTAGSSKLPAAAYAGTFEAQKAPTASTNARFISALVTFNPLLFTAYILNRSGQTIAANWTLKTVSVQAQYS